MSVTLTRSVSSPPLETAQAKFPQTETDLWKSIIKKIIKLRQVEIGYIDYLN